MKKESVFKVPVPRKDLSVTIAGVNMTPPMGLTSWAAFKNDSRLRIVQTAVLDLVLALVAPVARQLDHCPARDGLALAP
jgi:hypothetical protein